RIVVRRARKGEQLHAINDTTYTFNEVPAQRDKAVNYDNWYWSDDICAICDAERPQCLGGVMGGMDTEITSTTTDVLLESAYFMPLNNRATARGLGLHSDSSYRFSRGVDPAGVKAAQLRCAQLIIEHCGGEIADGIIEAGSLADLDAGDHKVKLELRAIRRVLGIDVPHDRVVGIMQGLGLTVKPGKGKSDNIEVVVPSARRDLTREIDLIEEVARIHGLDKIPTETVLRVSTAPPKRIERVTDRLADVLVGAGYHQTVTDSFVPETDLWRNSPWPSGGPMVVTNPVVKGQGLLRPAMVQSLLQIRRTNQDRGQVQGIRLFEQARVYASHVKAPKKKNAPPALERHVLAMCCDGKQAFSEIKGLIEVLGERLQIGILTAPTDYALFERGHAAEVHVRNADGTPGPRLGVFGDVASSVLAQYELQVPCAAAELDVDALELLADFDRRYRDLPRYPGMTRELAIVLPGDVLWQDVDATIRAEAGALLVGVEYLGEYRGKQIPKDRKQYNLSMQFQHRERSLTAEEINPLCDAIVQTLCKTFDGELRA
ncbi:MAG: phenylalanine--tRNA ligase subunit beta, partial [Planctomycetota bacterium]